MDPADGRRTEQLGHVLNFSLYIHYDTTMKTGPVPVFVLSRDRFGPKVQTATDQGVGHEFA